MKWHFISGIVEKLFKIITEVEAFPLVTELDLASHFIYL